MKYPIRPTAAQIRAARALLNWHQPDLAKACGVSRESIAQIESGKSQGTQSNMEKITDAFWQAGIEFIEGEGLRRWGDMVEILEGATGFQRFLDDIFMSAASAAQPFDIMACGVQDEKFVEAAGEKNEQHLERMGKIKNIRAKSINMEGEKGFVSAKYCEYRTLESAALAAVPFYIYGNNLAIIIWRPELKIILIRSRILAEAYKMQFQILWKSARSVKYG
jgi:transcriptional regulator with XRE-family HTH domain